MRRGAVVGALVGLAAVLTVPAARGEAPAQRGWWHGPTPLDVLLGPLGIPGLDLPLGQVSAVDVPPDGLLVAGGPAGPPAAYAAVAFAVGTAPIEGPLRLEPNPLAVTVPGSPLLACPLDHPGFTPAQGGRRQDAPPYDCLGGVAATAEPDGTYLVDVTTLQRGDTVAVALVPGSPTARIVLQAPGDDALPLGTPAPATADGGAPAQPAGGGVTPPAFAGGAGPGFDPVEGPSAGTPAPSGDPLAVAAPVSSTSDGDSARALVLGGIAAAGLALWVGAGQLGVRRRTGDDGAVPA